MDAKSLLRTCQGVRPRTPAPNLPAGSAGSPFRPKRGHNGDIAREEASSAQEETSSGPAHLPVTKAQGANLPKPTGSGKGRGWLSEQQPPGLTAGEKLAVLVFLGRWGWGGFSDTFH